MEARLGFALTCLTKSRTMIRFAMLGFITIVMHFSLLILIRTLAIRKNRGRI